jgi:5-aminopentanamidase
MHNTKVKLAGVQMDVKIGANQENLDKMLAYMRTAARNQADLIVFPECALSGYMFSSREEALPFMETVPGPSTAKLAAACQELNVYAVVGLLEKAGRQCFNAAALIGPQGLIGNYRKNHLPFLGIDRFVDPGNAPFQVFETPIGKIGLHICYDCTFPESARVMTLMGADILVLPTNWPEGRRNVSEHVVITRAYENRVHLIAVDRVGVERGGKFIGGSKIVSASGDVLAAGSEKDEQVLYAEIDLAEARQKRLIIKPGEFEVDCVRDRKPELYGKISEIRGK